jgi:hypothetical protein
MMFHQKSLKIILNFLNFLNKKLVYVCACVCVGVWSFNKIIYVFKKINIPNVYHDLTFLIFV